MNGGVELNGILGAFILMATPVVMAVVALINLIVYLAGRKSGQTGLRWSKYFLLSAVTFLFFDALVLMFIFTRNTTTLSRDEAVAFDEWMFYVWIPCHFFGYFLVGVALRYILSPKRSASN